MVDQNHLESKYIDYYELLPEPFRTLAIRNIKKTNYYKSFGKPTSMVAAICQGFYWDYSNENFEFWCKVKDYYYNPRNNKLPNLKYYDIKINVSSPFINFINT